MVELKQVVLLSKELNIFYCKLVVMSFSKQVVVLKLKLQTCEKRSSLQRTSVKLTKLLYILFFFDIVCSLLPVVNVPTHMIAQVDSFGNSDEVLVLVLFLELYHRKPLWVFCFTNSLVLKLDLQINVSYFSLIYIYYLSIQLYAGLSVCFLCGEKDSHLLHNIMRT